MLFPALHCGGAAVVQLWCSCGPALMVHGPMPSLQMHELELTELEDPRGLEEDVEGVALWRRLGGRRARHARLHSGTAGGKSEGQVRGGVAARP